ncbi:MAG: ribosome-associated translation inhibitor RaiA [Candidatus Paracaedibacteraceae bacterium]|nr:ribosome-associated translation inhibitor RaiA [Candidatus Paracaedibacteraceae bacterium]
MSIIVTGKQIEVGDSLKEFAIAEVQTVLTRYMLDVHDVTVTFTKDAHHHFKVDITLNLGHGLLIHAESIEVDAYQCIGHALGKIESQVRRYRSRLRSKKRNHDDHEHRAERVQKFVIKAQEEDTQDDNPLIIAETVSEIHTLSVGDAVMQMDLSVSPVMIFRNAANGEVNVVFKRPDGHIGWVDPSLKLA